jgi:hypothetical protein
MREDQSKEASTNRTNEGYLGQSARQSLRNSKIKAMRTHSSTKYLTTLNECNE